MVPATEQAWAALHTDIQAFVRRRVRDHADVEDVVQRVFLQVHRALPTLRDADRFHAWLYQTTRRAIADHYRAPGRRLEATGDAEIEALAGATVPGEASALGALAACLHPLIDGLAPHDREALRLVELDGLTQADAAATLGISISGIKSRVQRARQRLRVAVETCCHVELDRRGGLRDYERRSGACGCGPTLGCGDRPTPAVPARRSAESA